ncbi:hypothetical protein [Synechococcus sp. UW69]|uniref:hypothetical protein n=1 Tax=Synechococcus sp. UW69 TaxID=368493 RepID=UPI000E0ECA64|nr:hypothetical protein [Synechococcus sp. UW69]
MSYKLHRRNHIFTLHALLLIAINFLCAFNQHANAEATNNNTTVSNTAAPAASSVTTGGTNINYQTNTAFNNDFGYGPGIICRTPSLYMLTNAGKVNTDNFDEFTFNGSRNKSFNGTVGMTIPFGSSAIEDCKTMARQIAKDRVISTQLSLIKTCVSLAKDGIVVDPVKFPALKKCVIEEGEPMITKNGMVRSLYAHGKTSPKSTTNSKPAGIAKTPRLSTD